MKYEKEVKRHRKGSANINGVPGGENGGEIIKGTISENFQQ